MMVMMMVMTVQEIYIYDAYQEIGPRAGAERVCDFWRSASSTRCAYRDRIHMERDREKVYHVRNIGK